MNSQDIMDGNNNRAEIVRLLTEYCDNLGLSYNYTEKRFTIKLPPIEEIPIITPSPIKRKKFSTDNWPTADVDELPTEFPLSETPLDEGETPKGDDEK